MSTNKNKSSSSNHLNPFIDYIADDKSEEKLKDLFDFYDVDGNGMIQRQELIDVLSLCAHEIGLEVDAHLEQLADAVFSNANLNQAGSITYESLQEVLKTRPNLSSELSLAKVIHQSTSSTTSTNGVTTTTTTTSNSNTQSNTNTSTSTNNNSSTRTTLTNSNSTQNSNHNDGGMHHHQHHHHHQNQSYLALKWDEFANMLAERFPTCNKLRLEYISNNLTRCNFYLGLCLLSLVLIIGRIYSYWGSCGFLILARAAGQCLNLFCSIIVLLVCRRTISVLRAHGYSRYLPLDDHIYFHKIIGLFIVFHSLVHTCGHLANFLVVASEPDARFTYAQLLFSLEPGIGWLGGCASITGWLLLIIIIIMSLAQPFSRSLGKFELFYYTHLLYIPFWVLLFVHAPRFWMWFLGPFALFSLESLARLRNFLTNLSSSGPQTTIIKAVPLPSNVIHLVIKRPPNFEYNPGDWIYVLIPQIAKYEWHPFTISSAPEQEGVIWLHIRAVGEWTRSLRSFFEGLEQRDNLRRFIKSGQFSMSMDLLMDYPQPLPLPPSQSTQNINTTSQQELIDLSSMDSTRVLGATRNRVKDKLSQFKRKVTALSPIPESETSCETTTTQLSLAQTSTLSSSSSSSSSSSVCNNPEATTTGNSKTHQMLGDTVQSSSSTTTTSMSSSGNSSSMQSQNQSTDSQSSIASSQRSMALAKMANIKIFIDGPYGSPSSQIFRAEHAVLIATGIGVTPFASILQSIVHHYEKRRQKCPNCAHSFSDTRPPIVCKLRKVDFVWINRDQKSFEWFIKLLAELELTQSHLPPEERFLDIHIHLTAMEPAKTKSIGLQLALYLVHEKNKKDLVTGLRTRTKAGRPNWDTFFESIAEQKRGKVSVFFCGLPQLGRQLHRQCDRFGFKFRKEIF